MPTILYVGHLVRRLLAGWRCTSAADAAVADEPVCGGGGGGWGGLGSWIVSGLAEV